ARQAPWRPWQWGFMWEIAGEPDHDPLRIVDCCDDAALSRLRADLYGQAVPLTESPPLRVVLAHHVDGDAVMLGVNHAASDGLGSLRLLASILRGYARAADPLPEVDPLAVRDLRAPLALDGLPGRIRHVAGLLAELKRAKARIARDGGSDRPG